MSLAHHFITLSDPDVPQAIGQAAHCRLFLFGYLRPVLVVVRFPVRQLLTTKYVDVRRVNFSVMFLPVAKLICTSGNPQSAPVFLRSSKETRIWVGLMTAFWAVVLLAAGLVAPTAGAANGWLGTLIWTLMVLTPVAGIPLACVVAVLKYRLYEIDRLISRTVAYAIVTGLLVGVYAALVLLATKVLPLRGPVAVAGSTLAAAALFTPLRSRVQRMVDRRFNRARYDAEQSVAAFADRLKDAVDLNSVRDDLANAVQKALEPVHVSVWISDRG